LSNCIFNQFIELGKGLKGDLPKKRPMRASFDYEDEKMRSVDEIIFNYNRDKPTSRRISKSELLRKLLDLVSAGKINLEKIASGGGGQNERK